MSILERLLPSVGEMVAGRYELKEEIGRGGFGVVYRARQTGIEEDVALKILLPHVLENDDILKRFEREVVVAKGLRHPNSIRLLDVSRTAKGLPFYVMEFVRGQPLDDLIKAEGRLSTKRIQRILTQVLKSLGEAHSKGVIHRDLKPANLMISEIFGESDFVKVLDFGIAKALGGDEVLHQTSTGMVLGTPAYMSPEQALGKRDLDGRSDLYAVGLILAECLTGGPIVSGETPYLIVATHASQTPLVFPFEAVNSPLWPVIAKATAKDRDARFYSAEDMRQALENTTGLSAEVTSVPVDRPTYQPPPSIPGITPAPAPYPSQAPEPLSGPHGGVPQTLDSPAFVVGDPTDPSAKTFVATSAAFSGYTPKSGGRKAAIVIVILLLAGLGVFAAIRFGGGGNQGTEPSQPVGAVADNPSEPEQEEINPGNEIEHVAAVDPASDVEANSVEQTVIVPEVGPPQIDPSLVLAHAIASDRVASSLPDVRMIRFEGLEGVTVELNGQEYGPTPVELALPRVPENLEFVFHRSGYRSSSETVSLLLDSVDIDLRRRRVESEDDDDDDEEEVTSDDDDDDDDEEETSTSPFGGVEIRD